MSGIQSHLADLRAANPGKEIRADIQEQSIAVLHLGTWYRIVCKSITGMWVSMPYEILVNGERIPFEPHPTL